MTRAPTARRFQALTLPLKNFPACRSGMARSASLAQAMGAASSKRAKAHTIGISLFMTTPLSLNHPSWRLEQADPRLVFPTQPGSEHQVASPPPGAPIPLMYRERLARRGWLDGRHRETHLRTARS